MIVLTSAAPLKITHLDEKQLIEALQAGQDAAYQHLLDTFQEKVLNTCLGFVPNRHDAEDLVQ